MEKLIIFYDDAKAGCCRCVSRFETYENVECRKVSDYKDKTLIIWRMVADKKGEHMILVTGGRREFKAIRTASEDMEKRGYHVRNIYTRYILEKYKVREEEAIEWVLEDMQTGQVRNDLQEKYHALSRKEARKEFLREMKTYRKYRREQRKK